MSLPFKISLRFLKSSKGQTFLIAIGIAIGISVQIFIGSLITGLQKSLINKTIGNSPQIKITSNSNNNLISNYDEIIQNINNENITNLSISADGAALTKANDKNYSILIRGMNIDDSDKIYNIKERIYEGREIKDDFETLIGKDLKNELNLNLGDNITVISNSGVNETIKIV